MRARQEKEISHLFIIYLFIYSFVLSPAFSSSRRAGEEAAVNVTKICLGKVMIGVASDEGEKRYLEISSDDCQGDVQKESSIVIHRKCAS